MASSEGLPCGIHNAITHAALGHHFPVTTAGPNNQSYSTIMVYKSNKSSSCLPLKFFIHFSHTQILFIIAFLSGFPYLFTLYTFHIAVLHPAAPIWPLPSFNCSLSFSALAFHLTFSLAVAFLF